MGKRKIFKTISITLALCSTAVIVPSLTSCSVQQTKQPSIKQSINLNVKFLDLLTSSAITPTKTTDQILKTPKQLFDDEFKKNPEKFIDNYDVLTKDQIDNLKIETNASTTNDNFNEASTSYEQWSKSTSSIDNKVLTQTEIKKVYYPNDGSFLTISSPKELHDKLASQIKTLLEKIEGKPNDGSKIYYELNDKSKIGYTSDDDLLHVNITKNTVTNNETGIETKNTTTENTTTEEYDLCIPSSSIFYFVKTDTLKITSTKDEVVLLELDRTEPTYLNFDIGIQGQAMSEKFTKTDLILETNSQPESGPAQININNVLLALKWIKNSESTYNKKSNEIILDQEQISRDLNVFNVSFSQPKLFKIESATNSNTNIYRVGFTASPTINHSWSLDGGINQKIITTGDITIKNGSNDNIGIDTIIFDLSSQSETLAPKIIDELSNINSITSLMDTTSVKTKIETEVKKVVGNSNAVVSLNLEDFYDGKTMQKANVNITLSNVTIVGKSSIFKLSSNNIISLVEPVVTKLVSTSKDINNN